MYLLLFLAYLKYKYFFPTLELYNLHFTHLDFGMAKKVFFYLYFNLDLVFLYILLRIFWSYKIGMYKCYSLIKLWKLILQSSLTNLKTSVTSIFLIRSDTRIYKIYCFLKVNQTYQLHFVIENHFIIISNKTSKVRQMYL